MLNRLLDRAERAHTIGGGLPTGASIIEARGLPADLKSLREVGEYGEGLSAGRYFHYKKLSGNDGGKYLLVDVTEQLVVRRSLGDLLLIFGLITAVSLGLSLIAARWLSSLALRPFEGLVQLVGEERLVDSEEALKRIRETDVRMLAHNFRRVLIAKDSLVREQIAFNRGISHELRTPLQIIKSSLELLQEDFRDIDREPAFDRLKRAARRMERISTAFLWLATSDSYEAESSAADCLAAILAELGQALDERHIRVDLRVESDMSVRAPAPVLELMLYNLISNVARHARQTALSITVEQDAIALENPAEHTDTTPNGFGLGLSIVESLAHRFGLCFEHSQEKQIFRTSVSISDRSGKPVIDRARKGRQSGQAGPR